MHGQRINFQASDLKEDKTGYSARLISHNDLITNLGYENKQATTTSPSTNGATPDWVYKWNYTYWTMSTFGDSASSVWRMSLDFVDGSGVYNYDWVVRPVVTLKKSAL